MSQMCVCIYVYMYIYIYSTIYATPPPHAPTLQHGFQIKILHSAMRGGFKGGRDSHKHSSRSHLNNLLIACYDLNRNPMHVNSVPIKFNGVHRIHFVLIGILLK